MKWFFALVSLAAFSSCGSSTRVEERKVVPPPGSEEQGSIPWNDPGQGVRPGGVLGDMMQGR